MKFIEKLDKLLAAVERAVIVLLFSTLAGLIVFNVISRNIFHASFQNILEFSPALVLWLALVGSSLALKDNRHIKIEILLRFVSPYFRSIANKITAVFGIIVMGILCYASFEFVLNEISIFGIKGAATIIFPWFFLISFLRFGFKLINSNASSESIRSGEGCV